MLINANQFNFDFFLGGATEVPSLSEGAKKYGGATKFANKIISNIPSGDFINVDDNNVVSVFVPSTCEVDAVVDNSHYVSKVVDMISSKFDFKNVEFYNTQGSWYSDDLSKVVIEDITVVSVAVGKILDIDTIRFFKDIAIYVKQAMKQEGVSLQINNSLAIV